MTTFDEHLDSRYGEIGTAKRTNFESKAKAIAIGEVIKEERRLASMTQEQLPKKTVTKKVLFQELRMDIATFSFRHFINFWSMDWDAKYR